MHVDTEVERSATKTYLDYSLFRLNRTLVTNNNRDIISNVLQHLSRRPSPWLLSRAQELRLLSLLPLFGFSFLSQLLLLLLLCYQ